MSANVCNNFDPAGTTNGLDESPLISIETSPVDTSFDLAPIITSTRVKTIPEKEAKGKVKEIFEEIKTARQLSEVPNFWKSLANNPETLERTWTSLKQVMKKGALDPVVKELIYVAVSITNGCEYCIKSHSLAAKKKGATEEMLSEMIAVVGMANETNRLVEGYQVEVDEIYK